MAVLRSTPARTALRRSAIAANSLQPLALAARKSALGHTEPAAGALGLAYALRTLWMLEEQPLLHLNEVCVTQCVPMTCWEASAAGGE
jgi:3-oxoacyl-(acyl-carrier-protein) synthase